MLDVIVGHELAEPGEPLLERVRTCRQPSPIRVHHPTIDPVDRSPDQPARQHGHLELRFGIAVLVDAPQIAALPA